MTIYIALLRDINVGGKNRIMMAELKRAFEEIGLYDVQTYIQSGNVLFKSDNDVESLKIEIENKIEANFGFAVTVVIRTAAELEQIILNCPFPKDEVAEAEALSDTECLYVALLACNPLKEKIEKLSVYRNESDEYEIIGREVFLLLRHSIRYSKIANNLQKLDVPVTVRNWKTLSKLAVLAKAMEM